MKTTPIALTIMATLVIFSTITNDLFAQKTSTATMTIKATVLETVSMISLNEMEFHPFIVNDSGLHVSTSSKAEFVLSGSAGSEVNISMIAPESLSDTDGNLILFKPTVRIGNNEVTNTKNIVSNVNLIGQTSGFSGKSSVWVEGLISSIDELSPVKFSGDYLVSVSYN